MKLIERVRIANRVADSSFDEELSDLIEEAKADLKIAGAKDEIFEEDPIIRAAIVNYTKIHFGMDIPNLDQYERMYQLQKSNIASTKKYGVAYVLE